MADTSWLDAQSSPVGSADASWLDAHSSPIADSAVSAPEPTYDAALFKQRVGREPEPAELANFRASKGVGWAGDPTQGKFTAGQAAIGAGEDALALGTGALATIPAAGAYLYGLTGANGTDSLSAARATRNALTYQPGTEAGQAGMEGISQINPGEIVPRLLDASGHPQAADTVREVQERAGDVAPLLGVPSVVRGAVKVGTALRGVRNAVEAPAPVAEPPKGPGGFKAEDLIEKPQAAPEAPTAQAPASVPSVAEKPVAAAANAPSTKAVPQAPEKPQAAAANAPSTKATTPEEEAVAPDFKLEFTPPPKEGTTRAAAPAEQQAANEATLRAIGLNETRNSAISGDTKETGTDFQTSKLDNAAGKRMTAVINNEREAVRDYADNLVQDSGGSTGTDQAARLARGRTQTAPIEAYDDVLEAETKEHYKIADQRAAGKPFQFGSTQDFMQKNKSAFLGTVEGKQLFEGLQARAQELGLLGPNDTFNPATVEQAERFRQYLNDNWTPRTGRLVNAMKNALDEDVTRAAGEDIYAKGRAVRAARDTNLQQPKGVSKLLAPDDRLGINRQVAHEDVPDYIANLPADQFGQVVNVYKMAGKRPDIAPKAAAALNEIRAHFANKVKAAGDSTQGMWNAKAVHQYLADNNANMAQVFTPEEMQRFKTLNEAGNILKMDRSYPGAAAQGHNLAMRGMLGLAGHAEGVGALAGHIPGMVVGAVAKKGASALSDRALSATVEKRIRKL